MHDRLTIVQPSDRAGALAQAIRTIREQPLHVDAAHASLLDAILAAGDFERVRALLGNARPAPALPLFLARYVRWTGDLQTAAGLWEITLASLDLLLADDELAALRRTAAAELAATATDLGDATLAARLHRIARTAGRADELEDDGGARPRSHGRDAPDAVATVHEIAFDVLGIEPDATRGRLRLRPALDRHRAIEARSIRFADASVSLRCVSENDEVGITVSQDAGSIPITVLLEPFVPAAGEVTVDGRPAELKPGEEGSRITLPVQLVLDATRMLTIRGGS